MSEYNSRSRHEEIARTIEAEIVDGTLRPGQRIDEIALSQRFGVSRTPVREAIGRLASIGLVETRHNLGSFVARISLTEILEMFEVLTELEAAAGSLAAKRMTAAERDALRQAAEPFAEANADIAVEAYVTANAAFHALIYAGSHNAFLARSAQQVRQRVTPYRRCSLEIPQRMQASAAEHRAIADAIVRGDQDGAGALLRSHIRIEREFPEFVLALSRVLDASSRSEDEPSLRLAAANGDRVAGGR